MYNIIKKNNIVIDSVPRIIIFNNNKLFTLPNNIENTFENISEYLTKLESQKGGFNYYYKYLKYKYKLNNLHI